MEETIPVLSAKAGREHCSTAVHFARAACFCPCRAHHISGKAVGNPHRGGSNKQPAGRRLNRERVIRRFGVSTTVLYTVPQPAPAARAQSLKSFEISLLAKSNATRLSAVCTRYHPRIYFQLFLFEEDFGSNVHKFGVENVSAHRPFPNAIDRWWLLYPLSLSRSRSQPLDKSGFENQTRWCLVSCRDAHTHARFRSSCVISCTGIHHACSNKEPSELGGM